LQKGHTYYRCHTPKCGTKTIREERFYAALADAFKPLQLSKAEITCAQRWFVRSRLNQGEHQKEEIERYQLNLAQLRDRLMRLTDAYLDGVLDKSLLEERRNVLLMEEAGMKQKIAIARALIHEPKILFLDEPTVNLDPESSKMVREFILELKKENKTIFLNTHNLDEAQKICDKIGILNTKLMATGSPKELEESVWGSKTVIQLEQVNEMILDALDKLSLNSIINDDNKLTIDVVNPEKENPAIVAAIVRAGGHVQYVTELSPTLEDVYLKFVR